MLQHFQEVKKLNLTGRLHQSSNLAKFKTVSQNKAFHLENFTHPTLYYPYSKKRKLGVKKRENQDSATIFDPSAISAIINSTDNSEVTTCSQSSGFYLLWPPVAMSPRWDFWLSNHSGTRWRLQAWGVGHCF